MTKAHCTKTPLNPRSNRIVFSRLEQDMMFVYSQETPVEVLCHMNTHIDRFTSPGVGEKKLAHDESKCDTG